MIAFVLLCTMLLLWLAENLSRRDTLRYLHVHFEVDSKLVEPDEAITLRYTVTNTSRWPVLYAAFSLQLGQAVQIREEEDWCRLHLSREFTGDRIDHHFYLAPYQRFSGKFRFSVRSRGVHELGNYYLENGDLLGINPVVHSGDIGCRIVCTARRRDLSEVPSLGGDLGDISVRRFILDDPCMLLGYREYSGREPMKQISWLQTAKTGQLIVRRNDYTVDRNVTILVNMDAAPPPVMERCLETVRTVCELLEERKIPYGLRTNGDLFSLYEGLGRQHLFFIQRRIGLSRLTGYVSFSSLVDDCCRRRQNSSFLVVTPVLSDTVRSSLHRLRRCSDMDLYILYGGETLHYEKISLS